LSAGGDFSGRRSYNEAPALMLPVCSSRCLLLSGRSTLTEQWTTGSVTY